jgi:hypothetical protein
MAIAHIVEPTAQPRPAYGVPQIVTSVGSSAFRNTRSSLKPATLALTCAYRKLSAILRGAGPRHWMRSVFEGHCLPVFVHARPIHSAVANPRGFFSRLGNGILGSIGAQWFYQGETLGDRTPLRYVWSEPKNLTITLQTNSQPATDREETSLTCFSKRSSRS